MNLDADEGKLNDRSARVKRLMIAVMLLELVRGVLGTSALGILFRLSKCVASDVDGTTRTVLSRAGLACICNRVCRGIYFSLSLVHARHNSESRRWESSDGPTAHIVAAKGYIVLALEQAVSIRVREEDLISSRTDF